MRYRTLGRTAFSVSEVSFGAWAIGGSWGEVQDKDSLAALHKAIDCGVNFIDTADVYGMGRSERLIAQLKRARKEEIVVATKAGRRLPSQTVEGYSRENLTGWIEDSLRNLATDCLDLVQLHCPPTALYYTPEMFGYLDDLVKAGKIRHYGVSVERVEEALKKVPEPFRTTLILRDIEGFVYEEVAEMQGVNLGTVKSRLVRGRAALKAILLAPATDCQAANASGLITLGEEAR